MKPTLKPILLATAFALLATGPALASDKVIPADAPFTMGEVLGTSADQVQSALAAKGLELRKFEKETSKIEIYAVGASRVWEVKLDTTTGAVMAIEIDD